MYQYTLHSIHNGYNTDIQLSIGNNGAYSHILAMTFILVL